MPWGGGGGGRWEEEGEEEKEEEKWVSAASAVSVMRELSRKSLFSHWSTLIVFVSGYFPRRSPSCLRSRRGGTLVFWNSCKPRRRREDVLSTACERQVKQPQSSGCKIQLPSAVWCVSVALVHCWWSGSSSSHLSLRHFFFSSSPFEEFVSQIVSAGSRGVGVNKVH